MLWNTVGIITFARLVFIMIKNRTYTVLLFFIFTLGLKAQEVQGPYFVYSLLKNTTLSKTYDGFCQKNKVIEDSTAHGAFILGGPKCQPTVNYAPAAGFVGRDTATYEYKEYYTNKIKYWSFVYIVVNSHVELRPDIYSVDMNAADQDINPLTNDSCSIGTYQFLKIKTISAANQLVVSQPSDTTIRFRPETNFTGLAYISYTVCDTFIMWDESMDIPIEHQKLVLDRIKKSKKNPERMLDWDKASKNLKP